MDPKLPKQNPTPQNSQTQPAFPSVPEEGPTSPSATESTANSFPVKPMDVPPNPDTSATGFQPPASSTSITPKKSNFTLFMIILFVLALSIWGGVGYIYIQNQNLKKSLTAKTAPSAATETPSPTPAFRSEWIKIKNGNIVREIPGSPAETLVGKEDYKNTGITGFAKVSVSPDNSKLCFESWPPAPKPSLYVSGIDGGSVKEINPNRQNCTWKSNSGALVYVNSASKTSPIDVYLYDLTTESEKNLTKDASPSASIKRYQIVGFSGDDQKIICNYEVVGEDSEASQCEIDLETGEINLF